MLESFETRDSYLEDVPVADTVLVLQALAGRRGMADELGPSSYCHRAEAQRRAAAARSSRTIVRWPRTRLAGVSGDGLPANARATASAFHSPVTR